ncbi:MAG: bifunctional diaminohydroxyphosphoribosylaminopyrimidine deaminase/5-amino-6-(5-phosphoribosylamino)uracil reductase RibD [Spirochaetia bacterium]|nr:bifunctional diaminohydroxyphosphoribosylaminopyrimidine deaminase/5-amino-6-(5-phosphoribosylamino)uracil reductase RibD [Spirochaetia bacterium]
MNEEFMRRAIALAQMGRGFTNPNPVVGAVIVKNGVIVAEGFHRKIGGLHAEREAIKAAGDKKIDIRGACLFVTLEPCSHTGRQPPCTQAVIESGISEVFYGSDDPNPLVNGRGRKALEDAGIRVVPGFLKEECDALNPVFFHYIKTKMPYVILKYAMTADGQTATSKAESRWVTGHAARQNVHKTRSEVMAVLTGIGTAKKDNPMLNVRLDDKKEHRQPVRVILDSHLKLSPESMLAKTAREIPVIVFCKAELSETERIKKSVLESLGVKVLSARLEKNHSMLYSQLKTLGEMGIDSVLVESGGTLNGSFFFEEKGLVQELQVYIAPKIFGNDGRTIFNPVKGKGIDFPADCIKLAKPEVEFFGEDILLRYCLFQNS